MRKSFLHAQKPWLTAMIQCTTPEACIAKIHASAQEGADAYGIQLCCLERQYRTEAQLREIFAACSDAPIYITSYRGKSSAGMTDDECAELLLMGLRAGATLCDVMGDFYSPVETQLTTDETAIQKQKQLIGRIHAMGGEVLMSTHDFRPLSPETILAVAKAQESRGADILKIVIRDTDTAQLPDYLKCIQTVIAETKKPFLLLSSGPAGWWLRRQGPAVGVCMYLCVQSHGELDTPAQPLLREVTEFRTHISKTEEPI